MSRIFWITIISLFATSNLVWAAPPLPPSEYLQGKANANTNYALSKAQNIEIEDSAQEYTEMTEGPAPIADPTSISPTVSDGRVSLFEVGGDVTPAPDIIAISILYQLIASGNLNAVLGTQKPSEVLSGMIDTPLPAYTLNTKIFNEPDDYDFCSNYYCPEYTVPLGVLGMAVIFKYDDLEDFGKIPEDLEVQTIKGADTLAAKSVT